MAACDFCGQTHGHSHDCLYAQRAPSLTLEDREMLMELPEVHLLLAEERQEIVRMIRERNISHPSSFRVVEERNQLTEMIEQRGNALMTCENVLHGATFTRSKFA
jgi:hypothetical protein